MHATPPLPLASLHNLNLDAALSTPSRTRKKPTADKRTIEQRFYSITLKNQFKPDSTMNHLTIEFGLYVSKIEAILEKIEFFKTSEFTPAPAQPKGPHDAIRAKLASTSYSVIFEKNDRDRLFNVAKTDLEGLWISLRAFSKTHIDFTAPYQNHLLALNKRSHEILNSL